MASRDKYERERRSDAPQNWPDSKLRDSSLSTLSRALKHSLSQQQTLDVYIRWLEVHRQSPSNLSLPWDRTILSWAQSLRAQGFDQETLVTEIMHWKTRMGPFTSVTPYANRRNPPVPEDIAKAWPELANARRDKYQPRSNFSGRPPGNYVCNRCGQSGHFLQVCPTNLDPEFDLPPSQDYRCPICQEWGAHYSSLCPFNEDPLSVIQKRKKLGIKTPNNYRAKEDTAWKDWGKDLHAKKSRTSRGKNSAQKLALESKTTLQKSPIRSRRTADSLSPHYSPSDLTTTSSRSTTEMKKRLRELDDMKLQIENLDKVDSSDITMKEDEVDSHESIHIPDRYRAVSSSSAKTHSRKILNERSPSPTKARTLRKRPAEMDTIDEGWQQCREDQATLLPQVYEEDYSSKMSRDSGAERRKRDLLVDFDDVFAENKAPSSKRSRLALPDRSCHPNAQQVRYKMKIDQKEPPIFDKSGIVGYNAFVQKLIDCRPEMMEHVTKIKPRPSALDMWNDDDYRRFQSMSLSIPDEPFSRSSHDGNLSHVETDALDEDIIDPLKGLVPTKGSLDVGNLKLTDSGTREVIKANTPLDSKASKFKENLKPAIDWF